MPDFLPVRRSDSVSPIRRAQLTRLARQAESDVVRHRLLRWVDIEKEEIDADAAERAVVNAFEVEVGFYDYGILRAGASAAKRELLADKLEMLAALNNRRILRRFGR